MPLHMEVVLLLDLSSPRRDHGVFRELYRLDAVVASVFLINKNVSANFSGPEITSILNLHATVLAEEHKTRTNEFYHLFNKFCPSLHGVGF